MACPSDVAGGRPSPAEPAPAFSDGPVVLVGLGNPGSKYERTPHNLGFLALDELGRRWGVARRAERRWKAEIADAHFAGRRVWLVAPLTYMNLSGDAAAPFCAYHNAPPENTVAIADDHDLPWGRLRLRLSGGCAGHKGLVSLTRRLGTERFPRLRLGIRPANPRRDLVDYVLTPFFDEGRELAPVVVAAAADCVETALREGLEAAMARFNGLDLAAKDN